MMVKVVPIYKLSMPLNTLETLTKEILIKQLMVKDACTEVKVEVDIKL